MENRDTSRWRIERIPDFRRSRSSSPPLDSSLRRYVLRFLLSEEITISRSGDDSSYRSPRSRSLEAVGIARDEGSSAYENPLRLSVELPA